MKTDSTMQLELNELRKRQIIYIGERLKEISGEIASLNAERDTFAIGPAKEEKDRRRRIYVAERLVRIRTERSRLLAQRNG